MTKFRHWSNGQIPRHFFQFWTGGGVTPSSLGRGGGVPHPVWTGGVPHQVLTREVHRGTPSHPDLGMGYPLISRMGYPSVQTWDGVPPPTQTYPPSGPGMGYPPSGPGMGYPPPDLGWGTPLSAGWGTPRLDLGRGTPPPGRCERTDACENITFPIPSECGR